MFKVFYRGAYRHPREFNWVIGVILLLMTLLLSLHRLLASWDQLALLGHYGWDRISPSAVPIMAIKFASLMLGGNAVNANALLRFLCVCTA